MKTLRFAITLLTTLPLPSVAQAHHETAGRSTFWFPLVGLIIGAILWASYRVMVLIIPQGMAVLGVLVVMFLLTGGLHLDGLADTCDGIFSSGDRAKALLIMRDSRIGAMGVVAIVFDLLMRYHALHYLAHHPGQTGIEGALLCFPVLGRSGQVLVAYLLQYAREEGGLGKAVIDNVGLVEAIAAVSAMAIIPVACQTPVAAAIPHIQRFVWFVGLVAVLMTLICACLYSLLLGGATGDTLGATNEIVEIASLLAMVTLAAQMQRILS